ncbi:MAG: tyrosine-type recombinase/integrase [Clostridium paraputrificum]
MKGTVRKEGSTWYYLVCIGKDPLTNKYKYKKKRGFRTKKECESALAQLITEIDKGTVVDNDKMTVSDYLDYWMETYVKPNCANSTYKRYTFSINDIKTYLGTIKLSKLNPLLIEKFYKDITTEKRISSNTLLKTHRTFHLALKHAQQWQLIHTNYCDLVNKPKELKKEIEYWEPEKVRNILKKMEGHILFDITYIACHTGMRVGELCGLRWENVDLKKGTINVVEQLQRENGKLKLSKLKTTNSKRLITLYPSTIEHLRTLQNTTKIVDLNKYKNKEDDFVFHWEDGRPFDPHYVSQKFKSSLDYCGIKDIISFHGTRHTHATLLLKAGTSPKVISKRLGHSNVAFTQDTYVHVNEEIQKEETLKAAKFL